jgi:Reverse transcriptase (RNA-dependent DNA polymerase)
MKHKQSTNSSFNELDWVDKTKESLTPASLRNGLLDYGLFSEKVPPCFISVGLTTIVSDEMSKLIAKSNEKGFGKKVDRCAHDFIRYEAVRETNIPRILGVPHPEAYAVQCFGIAKNWEEIAIHCNKPHPPISQVYVRHVTGNRVFAMNYKGNERYELEEKEIQWKAGAQYVVKADIASCFPSIYTHSIPWALHGKTTAKSNNTSALTGNLLDKLTQSTRDKQTNGLIIGPHSSNVISEIVLTAIDVELQKKGYEKLFRHIDDYTFYARTRDEAEKFIKDLGLSLRTYEMSLNDKKTQILALPRPSIENWIQRLNRFSFPDKEITFRSIRSYLDLALECVQKMKNQPH